MSSCGCSVGADNIANFVITEDAHFAPLASAGYKPQVISLTEFTQRILSP